MTAIIDSADSDSEYAPACPPCPPPCPPAVDVDAQPPEMPGPDEIVFDSDSDDASPVPTESDATPPPPFLAASLPCEVSRRPFAPRNVDWNLEANLSGVSHVLAVDIENVPTFFADLAAWEVVHRRPFLPEGCYVVVALCPNQFMNSRLVGHILGALEEKEHLRMRAIQLAVSNASDQVLTFDILEVNRLLSGTVPITLVSSDGDFNELHHELAAEGVPFTRFQSYLASFNRGNVRSAAYYGTVTEGTVLDADAESFFEQLGSRLRGRCRKASRPVRRLDKRAMGSLTRIDYSSQISVQHQMKLIEGNTAKTERKRRSKAAQLEKPVRQQAKASTRRPAAPAVPVARPPPPPEIRSAPPTTVPPVPVLVNPWAV
eukprot:Rhum_TRINITY_DN2966_c0_g1::Rhum_TRINITY_DN2966_c0_g1_i1::g.9059::m.9059